MEPGVFRAAIVHSLETHGPASVEELAARLGTTREHTRHTVNDLMNAGRLFPVATVAREARQRGPSSWRYGTQRQAQTYAARLEALEAKVAALEQALLYGVGLDP